MPKPRFTTAQVRAATGLTTQDVKNLLARGLLVSTVEPARQGQDRHWTFAAAAELALLAAYRRACIPPIEGLAINARYLPDFLKSANRDSGSGWFALVRLDDERWEATALDEIDEPALEDIASVAGGGWTGDDDSADLPRFNPVVLVPARLILQSLMSDLARMSESDSDD